MAIVAAAAAAGIPLELFIAEEVLTNLFFQLIGQTISNALAPEFDALRGLSYNLTPGTRLSPQEAAVASVKGHLAHDVAAQEARFYGVNEDRFKVQEAAAGNPPPADFLLQLARRGLIPIADSKGAASTSAEQGIRESFLHDKWIPVLEEGQWALPSLGSLIESRLRNYITPEKYNELTHQLGLKDDVAHIELTAAGIPISPQEGYAAYHRGLIPLKGTGEGALSLETVFKESRIIDKYLDVWVALQEYLPPPRTITALLRAGSITEAKARDLFKKSGLADELITAYVEDASHQKTAATKELAVGTVVNMYKAREITRKQAEDFIAQHGYTAEDVGFLLDYADFQLVEAQVSALVTRVRTYYVGHKINKQTAVDALANVGMATETIGQLLAVWDQEAHASPALLTTTQLANAAAKGWIDPAAAYDEIQGRGYDARDAWVLLAEHKTDMTDVPRPAGILAGP